jgi:hypothetical protein
VRDAGRIAADSAERIATTGREAIAATERVLCGAGAVASPEAAQGVAAAGGRAASLLRDRPTTGSPEVSGGAGAGSGVWVDHRLRVAGAISGHAFELLASDAQQAVDQCLVAHRLAARIGRPGLCSIDADVAAAPALVQLPDAQAIGLLDAHEAPLTDDIAEAARAALADVGRATGRELLPVHVWGEQTPGWAIVATGLRVRSAVLAAELLREVGCDVTVIAPALLQPVPHRELRDALAGADRVIVLDPPQGPGHADLVSLIEPISWQPGSDFEIQRLPQAPTDPRALAHLLARTCGIESVALPFEEEEAGTTISIGVLPASAWSQSLLLEVAGCRNVPDLELSAIQHPHIDGLRMGPAGRDDAYDVLLVGHASLLTAVEVGRIRRGGTMLLTGGQATLSGAVLTAIREQDVVCKVQAIRGDTAPSTDADAIDYLLGGLLACEPLSSVFADEQAELLKRPALTAGQGAVEDLLAAASPVHQLHWPAPVDGENPNDDGWKRAVHRFHLHGRDGQSPAEPFGALPLTPWAVTGLTQQHPRWQHYPLCVSADGVAPLAEHMLSTLSDEGNVLHPYHGPVLDAIESGLERSESRLLGAALEAGRTAFLDAIDGSQAARDNLEAEFGRLGESLPDQGVLIGLGSRTLVELLAHAAAVSRRARRAQFRETVGAMVQRLEERLQIDAGLEPDSDPSRLAASFGGSLVVDVAALSSQLPSRRGSRPLGAERRARITDCLEQLQAWLSGGEDALPEVVLLHPDLVDADQLPFGVRSVIHEAGLSAAAGYFEVQARRMVDLFKALRIARLESDDSFTDNHADALAELDWQALSADELALVPPVVVLERSRRIFGGGLGSLSGLLRTGRPIHVIVIDDDTGLGPVESSGARAATHPDLGYLAIAHRDALVLQSSLAEPAHLYAGLGRLTQSLRPSLAVVASPAWHRPVDPWIQLAAAHYGRATPCFLYDPEAGSTWTACFELTPNPQIDEDWPQLTVRAAGEEGEPVEQTEVFTWAHAALVTPEARQGVRVLPPSAWSDEQVPIADYLNMDQEPRSRCIPYVWVVANDGELQRAILTREMAYTCADRLSGWCTLLELAGHRGEYIRRARAAAEEQAEEQQKLLEDQHEQDLVATRNAAAGDAMQALAQALLTPGGAGLSTLLHGAGDADATSIAAPPTGEERELPAGDDRGEAVEPTAEAPEAELGECFIESILCSSCNDCTKLNNRLFVYDANKQATIGDPMAGTYAELVKAAEACPSSCIHPGAPRSDDKTATPAMLRRARKFA